MNNGWTKQSFAYQTGFFEDENDDYIFIKNEIILSFNYALGHWFKGTYSKCSYERGIDITGGLVNINKFLQRESN